MRSISRSIIIFFAPAKPDRIQSTNLSEYRNSRQGVRIFPFYPSILCKAKESYLVFEFFGSVSGCRCKNPASAAFIMLSNAFCASRCLATRIFNSLCSFAPSFRTRIISSAMMSRSILFVNKASSFATN